jgi:predicted AlkP superfamily pyrophosphatase or phosphodiesterase
MNDLLLAARPPAPPRPSRRWGRRRATGWAVLASLAAGLCWSGVLFPPAAAQGEGSPFVILVSLDGFRPDYLDKASAPHLRRLVSGGVRAEGLIPAFPAKTFPNHYTIVTGLYPGQHGIVANNIRDAATGRTFAMSRRTEVRDPMWWGGEPFWVTAERAGVRTATMFWPGSETRIGGILPTHARAYDEGLPGAARVDQVLRWLDLADARRPRFLTLYFEDADTAGHQSGPDSAAVRRAIERLDGYVGRLLRGLDRRNLTRLANIVVVSDHGMAPIRPGQVLRLSDFISLSDVEVSDINPTLGLFPRPGREDAVYRALASASAHLKVYRRAETPAAWHYREHPRIPPIVGVVDEGWELLRGTLAEKAAHTIVRARGAHGYDPALPSMRGIFVAAGPAFRSGVTVPAFESVHVYNVLAAALAIAPSRNEGDPRIARALLR